MPKIMTLMTSFLIIAGPIRAACAEVSDDVRPFITKVLENHDRIYKVSTLGTIIGVRFKDKSIHSLKIDLLLEEDGSGEFLVSDLNAPNGVSAVATATHWSYEVGILTLENLGTFLIQDGKSGSLFFDEDVTPLGAATEKFRQSGLGLNVGESDLK